jgi:hypothetical protein
MRGVVSTLLGTVMLVGLAQSLAWADARVALVIGNADYAHVGRLSNPINDATDIRAKLDGLGFEVTLATDLDYNPMRLALRDFAEAARDAEVALIYYAGHGIEIDGTNYLIPVNAELRSDRDVEFEAIPLDLVVRAVETSPGLKIVLIDACRNNPFLAEMARTMATRSIGRGLGRIEPGGVLVGYAARSGTVSQDGEGRNSPYATALMRYIDEPGLEVGKLFRKVRDAVMEATDGAQEPFTYGSLPGVDLYLAAPDAETTEDISKIWQDFRGSTSPQALRVFAEEYSGTAYASLALERAMELEGSAPTMHQTIGEKPEAAAALGALGSPSIGLNRKAFCGGADDLEGLICSDMTLSVLSSKLTAEFKAAIDKAGPTEQAHIFAEERKWREERDVCGLDRECLIEVYLVWTNRRAEMENNIDGLTPMEIVRLVQIELSRLGCYSGEADGIVGAQTRAALGRFERASSSIRLVDGPASPSTLWIVRNQRSGLCNR